MGSFLHSESLPGRHRLGVDAWAYLHGPIAPSQTMTMVMIATLDHGVQSYTKAQSVHGTVLWLNVQMVSCVSEILGRVKLSMSCVSSFQCSSGRTHLWQCMCMVSAHLIVQHCNAAVLQHKLQSWQRPGSIHIVICILHKLQHKVCVFRIQLLRKTLQSSSYTLILTLP